MVCKKVDEIVGVTYREIKPCLRIMTKFFIFCILKRKLVGEEAFVRIAPAISGLADWPTAHNLFKALAGGHKSISFDVWSKYIGELLK